MNCNIKAFTDDFYKKVCKARLQPVLDNVKLMHELGVWVEVTTLLIPGLKDSPEGNRSPAPHLRPIRPLRITNYSTGACLNEPGALD